MECVAFIFVQEGQPNKAVTLLGAAEALRAAIDSTMTKPERAEYEQMIAALHDQVDEARLGQLWAAGQSIGMEQAIKYALAS